MSKAAAFLTDPPLVDDRPSFETILKHGHQDLVQAVAFNGHGDRCATGSVDGKIRVFNRLKEGIWRLCDNWTAHAGEILELQWLPTTVYPNLLASLGIEGRFKLWAEDPSAAPGRRFAESTRNGPLITIPSPRLSSHPSHLTHSQHPQQQPHHHHAPESILPSNPPPTSNPPQATGSTTAGSGAKPAFETRNPRSPYRSFSIKHIDDTRTTYLALLSADGGLTVYENDRVENLAAFSLMDEFNVLDPTAATGPGQASTAPRGQETSFRVRFDPNPDVCYTALRDGVLSDALGLVVAVQDTVKVYRTRDAVRASLGLAAATKEFYLAAEVVAGVHRGLVRDVAWAPGNIRGYDIIATACQDGFVRVFRLDTLSPSTSDTTKFAREPSSIDLTQGGELDDEKRAQESAPESRWSSSRVRRHATRRQGPSQDALTITTSGLRASLDSHNHQQTPSRELDAADRRSRRAWTNQPGQVRHTLTEISRLDNHRTPVWRVAFDDDGQILGSVGDEGKLLCYRQKPDGTWAKSSEMSVVKVKMAAPQ
ncbi:uncharacterized protein CTHT_0030710 [Thermochaetoides thermophila DSM 1495]|uniref:Nucleoporin SEH1 n=1 Tax=Chaetomium thermophilum (strain DSM 1495 / CBS 144.50 / IMI 039719) TaxID=759272 RepID=SEH1_CHATD|nr:hypothetical protein CTHT_0030710 [Thermochaetoides thermophila DSM 1495]G0S450.1 RecName: Full=Nucleoporin SEH1; AltName: Full=Nuclear pore protein SEH1 [Thermochaetoides thermophila DSM 1495]AEL00688.1 Seh1p [Thermochaetoides thermophila]EGS21224.1 hypothetical protein CTHT_0030710 [Thermochaetoides thermophila DSM 1495]